MLKNLLSACLLLLAQNFVVAQQIDPTNQVPEKTFPGNQPVNKNLKNAVTDDWQSRAESYITASEYFFNKNADNNHDSVANKKQRTGFSVNNSGFTVSPLNFTGNLRKEDNWKVGMQLKYIG